MIIPLTWLYEAFFILDLFTGLAWTTAAYANPAMEGTLVSSLGWISALAPFVHAIALGRGLIVRRMIALLPAFSLGGEAFYRLVLSPSMLADINGATPQGFASVGSAGLPHHTTALFFGFAFSLVGMFLVYPMYRRLASIFEEGAE